MVSVQYNSILPEVQADPYPLYKRLREAHGLCDLSDLAGGARITSPAPALLLHERHSRRVSSR